jgi:hypothetical protein
MAKIYFKKTERSLNIFFKITTGIEEYTVVQLNPVPSVKGTVSKILISDFCRKQHFPIPVEMPRNKFKFCQIAMELFVFIDDSSMYSHLSCCDSPKYAPPGSQDSPLYSSSGVVPNTTTLGKIPSVSSTVVGGRGGWRLHRVSTTEENRWYMYIRVQ